MRRIQALLFGICVVMLSIFGSRLAIASDYYSQTVSSQSDTTLVLYTKRFDEASKSIDSLLKRTRTSITSDVPVTETLDGSEYMARNIKIRVASDFAYDVSYALEHMSLIDSSDGGYEFVEPDDSAIGTEWVYLDVHLVDLNSGAVISEEEPSEPITIFGILWEIVQTLISLIPFAALVAVIVWGGKKIAYYFAHQEVPVDRPAHSILDEDIEDTRGSAKDSWYVDDTVDR